MKKYPIILAVFLMVIGVNCSHVNNVHYDYDNNVDFSTLKTYDWTPIHAKKNIDQRNTERVRDAVNDELQNKGFKISSDKPDFLITARLIKKGEKSLHILGPQSSGTFTRRREHSVVETEVEVGSLILDFVNSKSNELIWRGKAEALIDDQTPPDKQETLIKEVVRKILKKFPPPNR